MLESDISFHLSVYDLYTSMEKGVVGSYQLPLKDALSRHFPNLFIKFGATYNPDILKTEYYLLQFQVSCIILDGKLHLQLLALLFVLW